MMQMESHIPPDPEKTWQKIESAVDLFGKNKNNTGEQTEKQPGLKVAAVLVTLVPTAGLTVLPGTSEAPPFGWVFQD